MIWGFIPIFFFVVCSATISAWWKLAVGRREALLIGATLSMAWLVLGTELLSLFHAIRFLPLLVWWTLPVPVLMAALMRRRPAVRLAWPRLTIMQWILWAVIVFLLGWSLCQAIFSPPNNVDSNEYHLQRQVFWMQQASVANYAVTNLRQIAMPPLAEFAGLNLMVLTDGDRLHNLVQWAALVLCMMAVSLTTRSYGGDATAQLLSAVWIVTIPLAFMQSSTTKNDVVVMFWCCLLSYWILLLPMQRGMNWPRIVLIGLAFGGLILTKGTGTLFAIPLAMLTAYFLLRHHLRWSMPALFIIAILASTINLGQFARSYRSFGQFFPDKAGIHDGPQLGSEDHSIPALISGMLRNIGPHFVLNNKAWNDRLTQWMLKLHEKIGRDINDPQTTWMPLGKFRPYQYYQNDEDRAADQAQMLLLLLAPLAIFWTRRQLPWTAVAALLFLFLASFVFFSLLLKWQNWHVRLIIAVPALVAPIFGWVFGAARLRYIVLLPVAILLAGLWPSLNSLQRPLLGPKNIFHADPLALRVYYHANDWPPAFRQLRDRLNELHPKLIGFFSGPGSPDYPMQRLLLDESPDRPKFMVFNATLPIPGQSEPDPDVVLLARSNVTRLRHNSTGTIYTARGKFGLYTLMLRQK